MVRLSSDVVCNNPSERHFAQKNARCSFSSMACQVVQQECRAGKSYEYLIERGYEWQSR